MENKYTEIKIKIYGQDVLIFWRCGACYTWGTWAKGVGSVGCGFSIDETIENVKKTLTEKGLAKNNRVGIAYRKDYRFSGVVSSKIEKWVM